MSPLGRTPTYGDYPNYAANYAYSAAETLLREIREYLAKQQSSNDLVTTVEDALAALSECRGSLQQGYEVRPKPELLAAIDRAIDAVVLVNVLTDAVAGIDTETQLMDVRRARGTAG